MDGMPRRTYVTRYMRRLPRPMSRAVADLTRLGLWSWRSIRWLFHPMTGGRLGALVVAFLAFITCYIAYYLGLPRDRREPLTGIDAFIFGIPAAALAYAFQVRVNYLRRLDDWGATLQEDLKYCRNFVESFRSRWWQHVEREQARAPDPPDLSFWKDCRGNASEAHSRVSLSLDTRATVLGRIRLPHDTQRQLQQALRPLASLQPPTDPASLLDRVNAALDERRWTEFRADLYA